MTFTDKIKQKIWHFIYSFFLPTRQFFLKIGIVWHKKGRQKYHIGWLREGKTLEELKNHLHTKWGFGNHFIAWVDQDQVLSWRKLTDFEDQYHLRIYKDGEICGHFEFTPEAHPLEHMEEKGEREAKKDFLKFLGEFITEEKYISHLKVDPDAFDPKSEISVETKTI
jgi:hypothetical protein